MHLQQCLISYQPCSTKPSAPAFAPSSARPMPVIALLPPCNALPSNAVFSSLHPVQQPMLSSNSPSTNAQKRGRHSSKHNALSSFRHAGVPPPSSSCVCAATDSNRSPPPSVSHSSGQPLPSPTPFASSSSPPPQATVSYPSQLRAQQQHPSSAYKNRTLRRSMRSTDSFANESYDEDALSNFAAPRYPSTPFHSLSSMDVQIDVYSSEELLRPSTPTSSGRGGPSSSSSRRGSALSSYLSHAFPGAYSPDQGALEQGPGRSSRGKRSSMSMPSSYYTGKGLPGSSAGGNSRDPFAVFRAYQQAAPLQQGGVAGMGLEGGEHLQAFRRAIMPKLRKGWYASGGYNAGALSQEILARCERRPCGIEPLFLLVRLCESQEDARTALATISAVRASEARLKGDLVPFMSQSGHNLARAFSSMCCRCDASDVMASALIHASEVGLPITYKCVHLAMAHWAQLQELPKMNQVLEAMPQGGLPFTPKTAYIVIRGAVNAGRQELAEMYAARMMAAGVRLHPSVHMLLDVGRERAKQRVEAMQGSEDE